MNDYQRALEAAGAIVLDFQEWGDYQGSWCALVDFNKKTYVIQGYYGSCSGCDAFQSEFGYSNEETSENLKQFGLKYLEDPIDLKIAIKNTEDNSWDMSSKQKLQWLKAIEKAQFHEQMEELVK